MFVLWGTKRVEIGIGFVAEYCPICRTFTPFKVFRVGLAKHLYYIFTFGEGELVGHIAKCQCCDNAMNVNATGYVEIAKWYDGQLEGLIQKTFPNIREVYAERLELEKRIQQQIQEGNVGNREELLLEPFQHLANQVEARYANSTQFDRESGIGCVVTFILIIIVFATTLYIWHSDERAMNAGWTVFWVGVIYTFIQTQLGPGRYIRRKIVPNLAHALAPLKPTKQELSLCLAKLANAGFKIGKKVSIDMLWEALNGKKC